MEKMKIMVVEDDKMLANEISDFLLKWNYLVFIVKDFENLLTEFSKIEPQLILLDITYDNTIGHALSFFVCGILCFVISTIYNIVDKKINKQ